MGKRNRSRKDSIDIDYEQLPVEEINITANEDMDADNIFLRAESKTTEESMNVEEVDLFNSVDKIDFKSETEFELFVPYYIHPMIERSKICAEYMYNVSSIYLFWIILHYISAHLYVYYCTPNGVYGLMFSPFLAAAPHCRAIRWIIQSGGSMMDNMWLVFGTWACSKIIRSV